ncbi:hypothetical protein Y032_0004g1915 [Ancylostoma ceylanicum]|uniref:C-type lectin domain-containing protein n=1 Tax=Ancylostoma ceylanicum TaxID=53326 RepID=A0A016VUS9_9BILA|nr:hypothetical protein Y032_0004g1915 [Ancylostoma ceylanicum]
MLVFAAIALLLLPCPEAKEKKAEQCTRWTTKMGKCYAMYCGAHNYDEAEEVCKKANAHLVSIHSKVENRFIYLRQSVVASAVTPQGLRFCTHSIRSSLRWYLSRPITEAADTMASTTLDR